MGPVSSSMRLRLVGRPYLPFQTSSNCSPFNLISKLRLCLDDGEWISDMWSHTDAHILFLQTFTADPSGKRQITYSCLILLSCLNFKNKEDKQNKCDFLLILDLNFI